MDLLAAAVQALSNMAAGLRGGSKSGAAISANSNRLQAYGAYKSFYDSIEVRRTVAGMDQTGEILFNYGYNAVNIGADFLAGNPLQWSIVGDDGEKDEDATAAAVAIWEVSGGEAAFLKHALDCFIKGDACIHVQRRDASVYGDDLPILKWRDPATVFPEFNPHDCEKIAGLVVTYEYAKTDGSRAVYYEEWRNGKIYIEDDGQTAPELAYLPERFGGSVPVVWIANDALPGEPFGRSDLKRLKKLVERYDHLATKQAEIVDYYSNPNLYVKGVPKPSALNSAFVGLRKIYFLPEGGEIGFIEPKGANPMQVDSLDRIRDAISEISETPRIAFGRVDGGVTNVSGVALRILYGPLISKTRRKWSTWGPALERAMFYALRELGLTVTLDQVNVTRMDPLPTSGREQWETVPYQIDAGVSKAQILRERGYSDADIDKMEGEREEEAIDEAAAFNAGAVGAGNVPPAANGASGSPDGSSAPEDGSDTAND